MTNAHHSLVSAFLGMRSKLFRSVSGIVPQSELEDIVQETFLRIQEVNETTHIRNPESFIYRTARNLALDHTKRAETRLVDGVDDFDSVFDSRLDSESDATFAEAASKQEFSQFCLAVSELPKQCRQVFVLRKVYGFSQREIAQSLQISESTVEKHVAKGIRHTYQYLKGKNNSNNQGETAVTSISQARTRRGA